MPIIVDEKNAKIGTKVVRGRDWNWENQDIYKGKKVSGTIIGFNTPGWVRVKWEGGYENNYPIEQKFGLYLKTKEILHGVQDAQALSNLTYNISIWN